MTNPAELIVQQLREGNLTPAEAIQKFETPWKYPKQIGLDKAKIEVIDCGFPALNDHMLLKANTHELISLAALPGMGKSQLAFQIAAHVAQTKEVLFFSTEMTSNIIIARIAAARHTIPLKNLLSGEFEFDLKYNKAREDLDNLKLAIVDDFQKSISEVVRLCRMASKSKQLGLIVLDQMPQLMEFYEGVDGIGRITSALKTIARESKCPIINVCQLNRSLQNRRKLRDKTGKPYDDGKPMFADLKGSSCIEQDSDIVVVLTGDHEVKPNVTELGIIKNKNGKTGWMELKWYSSFVQFSDPSMETL